MVKGVTRELFYGTGESPGLVQCLTVFGDGKININTAPKAGPPGAFGGDDGGCGRTARRVPPGREKRPRRSRLVQPGSGDDRSEHPRGVDLRPERYLPDHGRRPPGKDDGADHRRRQAGDGSEEGQTPVLESGVMTAIVKSPDAALRFILRRFRGTFRSLHLRQVHTPHSSGFARLACGTFYEAVPVSRVFDFFEGVSNARKNSGSRHRRRQRQGGDSLPGIPGRTPGPRRPPDRDP